MRPWELIGAAAAMCTALGVIWKFAIWPVIKVGKRTSLFLEDWQGHPSDPARGIEERQGVMNRLARIENEVKYNGGSRTLVDAVKSLENGDKEQKAGITFMTSRIDEMAGMVETINDKASELQKRADENKANILANRANIYETSKAIQSIAHATKTDSALPKSFKAEITVEQETEGELNG
jgi:uncharacterized coiled-coil DUF342 family protein